MKHTPCRGPLPHTATTKTTPFDAQAGIQCTQQTQYIRDIAMFMRYSIMRTRMNIPSPLSDPKSKTCWLRCCVLPSRSLEPPLLKFPEDPGGGGLSIFPIISQKHCMSGQGCNHQLSNFIASAKQCQ
ncbi:unnamed protein product [Ostreobium quekettii]|uniref:Uncharacterized protein n=1 Tax=Ostreobium quekettii TaxID=121088 RepID=A0A8S1J2E7_9CHLO|nr:unnamed protein product [Ostreobium quekettii]